MSNDDFSVLHAPCHGPTLSRAAIKHALSLGADSTAFSEGYNRIPFMRTRVNYRVAVGTSATDRRRGAHDVPILTRRATTRRRSWWALRACRPSRPLKIAPERWLTGVVLKLRDLPPAAVPIEHMTAHPNAAVQGRSLRVDRVRKYAATMRILEARARAAIAAGHHVVITGDLNHGDGGPRWAPEAMFKRLGMTYRRVGLDWVAWTEGFELVDFDVIDKQHNEQDHPWLLAKFRIKPAYRTPRSTP